jgi:hypothetical protein
MEHYAFLDENNVVTEVIVGDAGTTEEQYADIRGQVCKRTSYGTCMGKNPDGVPFRKNFAGVGFSYDASRDAFIPPKLYDHWVLDEETCTWVPPVPYPNDGALHMWYEPEYRWIAIEDNCTIP